MNKYSGNWEFDAQKLLIRNRITGECVDLQEVDTPAQVFRYAKEMSRESSRDGDPRGFTMILRRACQQVFNSSLRGVYCQAGAQRHVNWHRRTSRRRQA